MGNRNLYGVMLKYPEPGMVKSRLARAIGEERAAQIYREMAGGVLKRTRPQNDGYRRIIFFSPADALEKIEEWIPGESFSPQRGGDIGRIMENAFREMFTSGAERVLLTGTDIPHLDRAIIAQGFSELERCDVVIGPAKDGGYYLIGMKSALPGLFRDISWGTGMVLQETLLRIRELNLSFSLLTRLSDLDRVEDLAALDSLRRKNYQAG